MKQEKRTLAVLFFVLCTLAHISVAQPSLYFPKQLINLTSEQVFGGNAFGKVLAAMPAITLPQERGGIS